MMTHEVNLADITNKNIQNAETILSVRLQYKVVGSGYNSNSIVSNQEPKYRESIPEKSVVILYSNKGDGETLVKVPDVGRKTIPEATQALNDIGLNIRVKGMGIQKSGI